VEIEGPLVADIFEHEIVDVEIERIFAGFLGKNDETGVVADDFVEDDARDRCGSFGRRRSGVGIAGRNSDDHVLDIDALNVARDVDDAEDAEIEREARDLDQGRNVGAVAIAQRQAFAGDLHARRGFHVEALQFDIAVEASAEFADYPFAGAVVDMAGTEKDKEDDPGDKAYEGSEKIGPKAKCSRGFSHQQMPKEKMLLSGEKFWMGGAGTGGVYGDGDRGVDIESDRREADFVAAGLIAELEGNVLGAERGVGLRCERYAEDDFILVDVERSFCEGERVKFAWRVGNFAGGFETSRKTGAEIGGNQVLGGRLARVDVEALADFEHDSELEISAAGYGFERNVCGGSDNVAAGRNLRLRGWQRGDDDQQNRCDGDGGGELHKCTCWPSC
jgi:hypothetical protein